MEKSEIKKFAEKSNAWPFVEARNLGIDWIKLRVLLQEITIPLFYLRLDMDLQDFLILEHLVKLRGLTLYVTHLKF